MEWNEYFREDKNKFEKNNTIFSFHLIIAIQYIEQL